MPRSKKSLVFHRAPYIYENTASLTSTYHNSQSLSYNDRLESGLGDCCYRMWTGLISIGRNLIGSDPGVQPYIHQFFFQDDWSIPNPITFAANNRMRTYMEGNDAFYQNPIIYEKLTHYTSSIDGDKLIYAVTPSSILYPGDLWLSMQKLRGAYNPTIMEDWYCPAKENGNRYAFQYQQPSLANNVFDSHATSMLGSAPVVGSKEELDGSFSAILQIKFTNKLDSSIVKTYTNDHTTFTYEDLKYYNIITDGVVESIPKSQWILGPYNGGGQISRPSNNSLMEWFNNNLAKDFRGSTTAWQDDSYAQEYAFDNQQFFTTPYFLGPGYCTTFASGIYSAQDLIFGLPTLTSSIGTEFTNSINHTTNYNYHSNYGLYDCYITVANAKSNISFGIYSDSNILQTLTLDTLHTSSFCICFPTFNQQPKLNMKLLSDYTGSIFVHCSEIYKMYPDENDLYYVLRLSSMYGQDVYPDTTNYGKEISDNYFKYHVPIPMTDGDIDPDSNTMNDYNEAQSFRKLQEYYNIIPAQNILAYEVLGDGKCSVYHEFDAGLYSRMANITSVAPPNGYSNEWLMFEQMKPYGIYYPEVATEVPGIITPLFNKALYYSESQKNNFTQMGSLYTTTNESGLLTFERFQPNIDNQWPIVSPEYPSCYNYFNGYNNEWSQPTLWEGLASDEEDATKQFAKSNPVHNPPYKVYSCVTQSNVTINGLFKAKVIKTTFTERFNDVEGSPAIVNKECSTWDLALLTAETYRTLDNGIRSTLAERFRPTEFTHAYKIGDNSMKLNIDYGEPTGREPFVPDLIFVKECPYVYEDGNDTYETTDTRIESDYFFYKDWILRNIASGFIQDRPSQADVIALFNKGLLSYQFANTNYYDYSYESLLLETYTKIKMTSTVDEYSKNKISGFGPFPNTCLCKEQFNQFSVLINKLYRARLILPLYYLWREYTSTVYEPNQVNGFSWSEQMKIPVNPPDLPYAINGLDGVSYDCDHPPDQPIPDFARGDTNDIIQGNGISLSTNSAVTTWTEEFGTVVKRGFQSTIQEYDFSIRSPYLEAIPFNVTITNNEFYTIAFRSIKVQYVKDGYGYTDTETFKSINDQGTVVDAMTSVGGTGYYGLDEVRSAKASNDTPPAIISLPEKGKLTVSGVSSGDLFIYFVDGKEEEKTKFTDTLVYYIYPTDRSLVAILIN